MDASLHDPTRSRSRAAATGAIGRWIRIDGESGRAEAALLWVLLVLAAVRRIIHHGLAGELFGPESPILYHAGTLGFNYFDFGALRRGLGGTIAHLLADDLLVGTLVFHTLFSAIFATCVCVLWRRIDAPALTRLAYATTLVAIFLRWGNDAGRTDMAIVVLFAFATFAAHRRRLALAVACLCIGLFIHETSFIFGLPLLAAIVLRQGVRSYGAKDYIVAGVLFVATIGFYLAMSSFPQMERQQIVDGVRAKLPASKYVDWAIYFALSGFRGVEASICQNLTDPSYWSHPAGGLLVIGLAFLACAWAIRTEWWTAALAALPGFVFLCIVANDIARWTMFSCIALWLLQASSTAWKGKPSLRPAVAVACALLMVLMVNPRGKYSVLYPIYAGSSLFEHVVQRLGGAPTPNVEIALFRCDPSWLEVLGDPTLYP